MPRFLQTHHQTLFDYSLLTSDAALRAGDAARAIRAHVGAQAKSIIEVGRILREMKSLLGHGTFGRWIVEEFAFTPRTAQNYMAASELADQEERIETLRPAMIYKLAAPSTPPTVRAAVIEQLNSGVTLVEDDIMGMIKQSRQKAQDVRRAPNESIEGLEERRKAAMHKSVAALNKAIRQAFDDTDEVAVFLAPLLRPERQRSLQLLRDKGYSELAERLAHHFGTTQ
jgi:hypothetical protein